MAIDGMIKESVKYRIRQEPIVISNITTDILLKEERPADLMALYWFYYYIAKWPRNDKFHVTSKLIMDSLKWSAIRVRKTKKELIRLGLLECVAIKDEKTGRAIEHSTIVKFMFFNINATVSHTGAFVEKMR
jgi:hypothetical protein